MSKAALNIAGTSLAHDLKPANVSVALLHPGYVQTEMGDRCWIQNPLVSGGTREWLGFCRASSETQFL